MYKKTIIFLLIILTTLSYGMEKKVTLETIEMLEKSKQLFSIATNKYADFTKEDLSDPFWINSRYYWSPQQETTLLYAAYKGISYDPLGKQLQKVKDLINAGADVKKPMNNDLLRKIAKDRAKPPLMFYQNITFNIAQLLLEHGANPNFHTKPNDPTPLMIAVCRDDKEYAQLLLSHNASPYKTGIWIDSTLKNSFEVECEKNAFDLEPTGWLKTMFKETVYKKHNIIWKYWVFKEYNLNQNIFPQELVQIIVNDIWESCIYSFKKAH